MAPVNRVIFWDFDGTLARREGGWTGALAGVLSAHDPSGLVARQAFAPFLQAGFPWHTPEAAHPDLCGPGRWWACLEPVLERAFRGVGLPDPTAGLLATRVRRRYLAPGAWRVYDDVLPVLSGLRARGWRHVVRSNHVPELPALVEALGLGPLVDGVVTSAQVGDEKPHAEIFRTALRAAGGPDVAWMVGDSATADVLGAEEAGIPAILVRRQDASVRRRCADLHGVPALIDPPPPTDRPSPAG